MKIEMNRYFLLAGMLVAATARLAGQDASQASQQSDSSQQNSPYAGVSHPPSDVITTSSIPEAKPPAGQPVTAQPLNAPPAPQQIYVDPGAANAGQANLPAGAQGEPRPTSVDPSANFPSADTTDGTDSGVVSVAPYGQPGPDAPALSTRGYGYDPDGDIVHPHALRPGELQEGTSIRVRLLDRLSTSDSEKGEPFHTRVATDVLQGGNVVIPAGAEIDGRVVEVSSGHAGGHGTMRLQPDAVILPNGERFHLRAEVTGAPGSGSHVVGEGTIRPDSRARHDGIEYGGAVGTGVVVGAIVAGPAGALTGGLIGAGAVTVHLLVSHPQATLESGTTLIFQLTDRLYLAPEAVSGN